MSRAPCPAELAHAESLRARIAWALSRSGMTQAAAERSAGLASGTLGHVLSGRRSGARLGLWRLGLLAGALRVRAAWLVLGEGPAWWCSRLSEDVYVEEAPGVRWRGTDDRREVLAVIRDCGGTPVAVRPARGGIRG